MLLTRKRLSAHVTAAVREADERKLLKSEEENKWRAMCTKSREYKCK